jgi:hypothetical protein
MRLSRVEGLRERSTKPRRIDLADPGKERDVGEILDARVRPFARKRVGVELFGDVRLNWVEPQRRRFDTREAEDVVRDDDVGLSEDRRPGVGAFGRSPRRSMRMSAVAFRGPA